MMPFAFLQRSMFMVSRRIASERKSKMGGVGGCRSALAICRAVEKKATRKCPSISDLRVHRAEWTACRYLLPSPCHQDAGAFSWVANGRCK